MPELPTTFLEQTTRDRIVQLGQLPVVNDLAANGAFQLLYRQLIGVLGFNSSLSVRTVAVDSVLNVNTDKVIIALPTVGPIRITLPLASTLPANGAIQQFYVINATGTFPVIIETTAPDTFPRGNTEQVLVSPFQVATLGGLGVFAGPDLPLPMPNWGNIDSITVTQALSNSVPVVIGAGTFSVNWQNVDQSDNPQVIDNDVGGANPDQITIGVDGCYDLSYWLSINKIAAGTWTGVSRLTINGVPLVPTTLRTGSTAATGDGFMSLPAYPVRLFAGDIIELEMVYTGSAADIFSAGIITRIVI